MEHVFNIFEDDQALLASIQRTAEKVRPFAERIVAAQRAVVDLCAHNWTDELFSDRILNKIRHRISNGDIIYNKQIGLLENTNIHPIPIEQWVLQLNYAKGTDEAQPVLFHYDAPEFVCVMLVNRQVSPYY